MVHAVVEWAYKQIVTSAKLAQMVENHLVHDHRADGTQGAALVGAWQTAAGVTAATGWTITGTPRYRLLSGGATIVVDVTFTRTGAEIRGNDVTENRPGNIADAALASGWPAAARPTVQQEIHATIPGTNPATVRFDPSGIVTLVYLSASAPVAVGDQVQIRGPLWAG